MGKRADYRPLEDLASATPGWSTKRRNGKLFFYPADESQRPVVVHATESDHRAMKNTLARLKRAGLPVGSR